MRLRENTQRFGVRRGREINGGAPLRQQSREATDMIGMFVGDDDAVEPVGGLLESGKAAEGFALAQACVHQ